MTGQTTERNINNESYEVGTDEVDELKIELKEGLVSDNVTNKDHLMLLSIAFIPFIFSTIWHMLS